MDSEQEIGVSEEELQKMVDEEMEKKFPRKSHYNRAERRAFKKKHHQEIDTVYETARKLTYINLIEKLREKQKENEETNEQDSTENS